MKVIAFYLPQYYEFEENNKWWGKGFTEWTNVRGAKPLFRGHYQPTIPLNENFYCLEDEAVFHWQVQLAQKYGIYGFCFYYYWMGEGRQLMQKPIEMYLKNKNLDFPFCLSWANHNWARTWTGGNHDILMEVKYGSEDEWETHFSYLLAYFQDSRYIKMDEKPVLLIYQPELIPKLHNMLTYMNKRAKEEGLGGITFISQAPKYALENLGREPLIPYSIMYEPNYTDWACSNVNYFGNIKTSPKYAANKFTNNVKRLINKITLSKIPSLRLTVLDYDAHWEMILNRKISDRRLLPGAFINFDNTPRKGYLGTLMRGFTVEKFGRYFKRFVRKVESEYEKDMLFLMAWNEWGEGAYIEPDEKHGYACLEAIKIAVDSSNSQISGGK